MARMLGTWTRDWCPTCKRPGGPDCWSRARTRKSQRLREKREWHRDMQKTPAVVYSAGVFWSCKVKIRKEPRSSPFAVGPTSFPGRARREDFSVPAAGPHPVIRRMLLRSS